MSYNSSGFSREITKAGSHKLGNTLTPSKELYDTFESLGPGGSSGVRTLSHVLGKRILDRKR